MDDLPPAPAISRKPASPRPQTRAAQREARLKLALKANMGRRKAQARGRADQTGISDDAESNFADDNNNNA